MLALCIAPLTLRLAPRALPPSRRCAALTLRASPNPELPPEDSSPEEPQAEESLDFSEDFAAGKAYGESIRARFLAPRIDDPGLPYADALVCVCGALFVSQWALSPAVPIWLKIPLPSWLAPLPLPAGVDWRGIPYVVPALSHGAALASCWLLGALAASAFEADAYMGTWREALARTWRAGAFAVGVLIFGTQLSLYVSLSAQGLDPYTIPSAEALDLGAKADTQILSTAFELICDATVQAVGLTLFRLYRWRDAQGQGPPPSTAPAAAFELAGSPPPVTTLTEEEAMMREAVARFSKEELAPLVRKMDDAGVMEPSIIQGCFDNGFMGVEVPEKHGGCGSSFTAALLVVEELAKVDPSVSVMVDIHNTIVNNCFSYWANERLKEQWLPRLATDTLGAFALSESSSGSDAFALKTTARRDGEHYILNGEKMWISNSQQAGVFLVMANAAPEAGYKGITCFVVPADAPGLSVGKPEDKLGIRASATCPLRLDDVRVPATDVLGEVGMGYKYAINILNEGRIGIGAQMVGLAQGALDLTLPYVHERKQFGTRVADFQGVQHQVAQAATELHAARLVVYNAARIKEAGGNVVQEAAMAKLLSSQVAERVASRCIELLGGVGFTKDVGVEKFYRDAKIGAIYEGTSNIQLQTIAKLISANYKA